MASSQNVSVRFALKAAEQKKRAASTAAGLVKDNSRIARFSLAIYFPVVRSICAPELWALQAEACSLPELEERAAIRWKTGAPEGHLTL
jgi:hypothetical protein